MRKAFPLLARLSLCFCLGLAACGRHDPKNDLNRLTRVHRQLLALNARLSAASDVYTRDSNLALNAKNNPALNRAAANLRVALGRLAPEVADLAVPDFADGTVRDHVRSAIGSLAVEIGARETAAEAVRLLSDPHKPRPGALAAVAAAMDAANSAAIGESSEIIEAYGALGITPDRVDTIRGGVRKQGAALP